MPEPLKNLINEQMLIALCDVLARYHHSFDSTTFIDCVLKDDWHTLELKQRMSRIRGSLNVYLPADVHQAIAILKQTIGHFSGFEYMYFPEYIEVYAIDDYELAIDALAHMTEFASSEFAVRPFIVQYPNQMMGQMLLWAKSDNHHIRRLACEGCRPRLPWAMALPEFKKNPSAILPILELLKADDSEYVRRSVANNLNDISKDNPDVVINIAKTWLGDNANTDWVVKHACRGLLKQGHPEVMALFGYGTPDHIAVVDLNHDKTVAMGDKFEFSCKLVEKNDKPLGKIRIEFAIGFMKSNGKQAKKVFKITEGEVTQTSKQVDKYFSFKPITTRKYYTGIHGLSVIVNGVTLIQSEFELVSVRK